MATTPFSASGASGTGFDVTQGPADTRLVRLRTLGTGPADPYLGRYTRLRTLNARLFANRTTRRMRWLMVSAGAQRAKDPVTGAPCAVLLIDAALASARETNGGGYEETL